MGLLPLSSYALRRMWAERMPELPCSCINTKQCFCTPKPQAQVSQVLSSFLSCLSAVPRLYGLPDLLGAMPGGAASMGGTLGAAGSTMGGTIGAQAGATMGSGSCAIRQLEWDVQDPTPLHELLTAGDYEELVSWWAG